MYEWYFMYKDIVPEKTRKHEVAFQGTPPPTPQYAAHRSAQRGFPRRLGTLPGCTVNAQKKDANVPNVFHIIYFSVVIIVKNA
jgi:hypothetical protein